MAHTHEMPQESKTKKHVLAESAQDENPTRYAVTIEKAPHEVFAFFRKFENIPKFMKDIKSVKSRAPKLSHWTVELESGVTAEWDAEITDEEHADFISWKSVEGSEVETSGTVHFAKAPQDRGTEVSLQMDYRVPGEKLTELVTKLNGEDPDSLALINLRRLKALLETEEIPTTEGQPSGRAEGSTELKH